MVTNRILFVFTIFIVSRVDEIATKNILRKCCGKNEHFSYSGMMLKCVNIDLDVDFKFNKTSDLWWIPQDNIKDRKAVLKHHDVAYKAMPTCPESSQDMLAKEHFHLHVVNNRVQLEVVKDASLHDPDVGHGSYFPSESYCVEAAPNGSFVALVCPCSTIKCVRKCCMDTYAFDVDTGKCVDVMDMPNMMDWSPGIKKDLIDELDYYRLANKRPTGCKKYVKHVIKNVTDEEPRLHLLANGSIQNIETGEIFAKDSYCGDFTTDNEEMLLHCPPRPPSSTKDKPIDYTSIKYTIYGILFIIGAIALFLVVVVAIFIPELRRNIHGKMSLAHNSMLLIGYVTFGVVLMVLRGNANNMNQTDCKVVSFIIQYAILSAFFWLNVMCIDIAWAFSGLRPIQGRNAIHRDCKKFAYYSLYAWGSTAFISIITAIVEFSPDITKLKPNFGNPNCFFSDRGAMLLFFFGPMAILLLVNIILFTYTAAKIIAIKRQTAILNSTESSTNKKNKQRLILYVKLFSIMGVTWVFEVISWAVNDGGFYWIFTDVLNLLRGVFIFIIFCCKRSVYNLVRDKGRRLVGKQGLELDSSFREQRSFQTNSSVCNMVMTPEAKRKHLHRSKKQHSKLPLVPIK